jgi:molybdopterin-guanine dinucleotide biosynthesis protein A
MPFVTPALIDRIAHADPGGAPAVIAAHEGASHPLLGCYQPQAAELLGGAAAGAGLPLREVIAAIRPRLLEVDDPDLLFNINAPDDLLQAAGMLDSRAADQAPRSSRT